MTRLYIALALMALMAVVNAATTYNFHFCSDSPCKNYRAQGPTYNCGSKNGYKYYIAPGTGDAYTSQKWRSTVAMNDGFEKCCLKGRKYACSNKKAGGVNWQFVQSWISTGGEVASSVGSFVGK
ncbi:hypothetical protein BGZ88_004331 [Linnemannia elongata]|uniref:Uncharacterized protein n=1 Tax=Linnemannia elongata AG-77 TaxID=1314771 RepID=A0A197JNS7_9FUNG|nr:hypothetical protein BGZ88_004331 [Linnemannia elongata]OAQ26131.1 hypothetical protein K457DRAFT_128589 [Linnemannia elongata AG-77]